MGRKARSVFLGALAALMAVLFLLAPTIAGQERAAAASVTYVNFTVTTSGYNTNVRSGPGLSYSIVRKIPPNTSVACDGWTYGDVVQDLWLGTNDARWYKIKGKNEWVASGVVKGNAPGSTPMPPSPTPAPAPANNFISPVGAPIQRAWPSATGWYGGGYGVYNWYIKGKYHTGLDVNRVGGDHGCPVYSTASGVVVYSGFASGWGNVIVIRHSSPVGTVYSLYGHLSQRSVANGKSVAKGQLIGKIGSTGNSSSAHLHFEIKNQACVNSLNILGPGYTSGHPNNYGYFDPLKFIDAY